MAADSSDNNDKTQANSTSAAEILDGRLIAKKMQQQNAEAVAELVSDGIQPHLIAIQLGEPAASKVYTRFQQKACEDVGINYELKVIPPDVSAADLYSVIDRHNQRSDVTGIILQMPLPPHINPREACNHIDTEKDVEGMHAINYGRLFSATGSVAPCTALAAVELLKASGIEIAGAEAVIVGHSEIVGKPIGMILLQSHDAAPTLTFCHVATKDLAAHTRKADILFVATGVRQRMWEKYSTALQRGQAAQPPNLSALITGDMIKPGAVVIDVATNRIPRGFDEKGLPLRNDQGKIERITVGDVDFDSASKVAGFITPVPGGVGPVTVQMLLKNTVACAMQQRHHKKS